jgi:hypothetical protein
MPQPDDALIAGSSGWSETQPDSCVDPVYLIGTGPYGTEGDQTWCHVGGGSYFIQAAATAQTDERVVIQVVGILDAVCMEPYILLLG